MNNYRILPFALSLLLPLAAQAASVPQSQSSQSPAPQAADTSIRAEIQRDLAEARSQMQTDLAQARKELETGNLSLGDNLQFGKHRRILQGLPKAEITPEGDFLIAGTQQILSIEQRRQLLTYRALVLEIAKAGIDIGQKSADAALKEVDRPFFSLLFSAMSGSLDRRIERTVQQQVQPGVLRICNILPKVMASQHNLVDSLPSFRPYANLERDDIKDCEHDARREFAAR